MGLSQVTKVAMRNFYHTHQKSEKAVSTSFRMQPHIKQTHGFKSGDNGGQAIPLP